MDLLNQVSESYLIMCCSCCCYWCYSVQYSTLSDDNNYNQYKKNFFIGVVVVIYVIVTHATITIAALISITCFRFHAILCKNNWKFIEKFQ